MLTSVLPKIKLRKRVCVATRNHVLQTHSTTLAFRYTKYLSMQQASRLSLSQQNAIWPIREAISVP